MRRLYCYRFLETSAEEKWSFYGINAVIDLLNGTTWHTSGYFPRVTICDFQVRGDAANVQRYSVQCVLVINIFTEKIFIFLWFWYVILAALTAFSFFYWLYVTVLPCPSWWFVSRHLELSEMPFDPKANEMDVKRFVSKYVKTDGVFVLRMITSHAGIIFGTDLVLSLWRSFYGIEEQARNAIAQQAPYLTPTPPYSTSHRGHHFELMNPFALLRNRKKSREDSPKKAKKSQSEDDAATQLILCPKDRSDSPELIVKTDPNYNPNNPTTPSAPVLSKSVSFDDHQQKENNELDNYLTARAASVEVAELSENDNEDYDKQL